MADDWWAEQEMFGAVTDETGEPMTTTDTDALTERIVTAMMTEDHDLGAGDYARLAARVLPIVAVEVRKAKAEAWDEGAQDAIHGFDIEDRYTDPINPYREAGDCQ